MLPYEGPLLEGRFVHRPNRFVALCEVPDDGEGEARCFLPNPGRLHEFRQPGRRVLLQRADPGSDRSTAYTVLAFRYNDRWVSVDTHLTNHLFRRGFEADRLAPFRGYGSLRAEVTVGDSRLDFLLSDGPDGGTCYVEVKSVTLVVPDRILEHPSGEGPIDEPHEGFEDGVGYFPDAVTTRGARHARELAELAREGNRAAIAWIVQRDDARVVRPEEAVDPDLAAAVREADAAGVETYAWEASVTRKGVSLGTELPVDLGPW